MGDGGVQDLLALDRDVARGVALLGQWRAALALDPASCADADEPLEEVRWVTGKSTWDALGRLEPPAADRPLCEALRRWVYFLLQARVGGAEERAWACAAAEPNAVLAGDRPLRVAWRDAWRGVIAAPTAAAARPWLDAAAELAPPLAAVAARRAARRVEVARRLGLAHPSAPLVGAAPDALRGAAMRLLDATDDLWSASFGDALRDGGGAAAVIPAAIAREAGDGWPAHLTARWLEETLRVAFVGPPVAMPRLPGALGAASFARALQALGFALRAAPASGTTPFALAREPAFVGAHRLASVLGALPADPAFQVRALGLGSRVATAQARVLARAALFEVRLGAVRLLLGDDAAPAPRALFDELTARMFGRGLDPRLCGAWPPAREDESARWLALLETPRMRDDLRDRFDADWFRNPRAWQELRGASFAREPVADDVVRDGPLELARAFEAALG